MEKLLVLLSMIVYGWTAVVLMFVIAFVVEAPAAMVLLALCAGLAYLSEALALQNEAVASAGVFRAHLACYIGTFITWFAALVVVLGRIF
jgi:hypothetical protein